MSDARRDHRIADDETVQKGDGASSPGSDPCHESSVIRFEDAPTLGSSGTTEADTGNEFTARGEWVGPYRLIHILGEGGMGTVYRAEQYEPVRRTVALKLMRSSLHGPMAVARFTDERQALARLSHPNIATMFEAGTTEQGFPFFVMELVSGMAITDDCDSRRLTLRQRIEAFIQVCQGVLHAHQKGIIHRDLKPSNVLVGDGVPKIIDFGIAKAIDQPLTGTANATAHGIVGTPAYMSPEAFYLSGSELDTRTDVYSLGVLLSELLAGVRPHDLEGLHLTAIMKKVSEEESPALLYRFMQLDETTRGRIASSRQHDQKALTRTLSGDLGWIARKATARDREERYASVAELAADLARHLRDQPVSARPPTLRDRATKFVRRHRITVIAASLVMATMIGGVSATVVSMLRAQRARAEAESVSRFILRLLESASPWEQSSATTVREVLDRAAKRIPTELGDQPQVRAELMNVIGSAYFHLNQSTKAEPLLRESLRLRLQLYGPQSPRVAGAYNELALVVNARGSRVEAERMLRQSLFIRERAFGHEHRTVARSLLDLASRLSANPARNADAETLFRETIAMRERLFGKEHSEVAMALPGLANILLGTNRLAEGEALLRRALRIEERANPSTYRHAMVLSRLGMVLTDSGRFTAAEPLQRQSLTIMERFVPQDDVRLISSLNNLGITFREEGKLPEAEPFLRRSLDLSLKRKGMNDPIVGNAWAELGLLLLKQGKRQETEHALQEALRIWLKTLGPNHPWVSWPLSGLGNLRRDEGRYAEAEDYYKRALLLREKAFPKGVELRTTLRDYAKLLSLQGRSEEAAAMQARAAR